MLLRYVMQRVQKKERELEGSIHKIKTWSNEIDAWIVILE